MKRIQLSIPAGRINREAGQIFDVSLMQVGVALGHGLMVSDLTLESVLSKIEGKSAVAYLTHGGNESDRLLDEIGTFENFRIENGKLVADVFQAFESFARNEKSRFDRLFDIAEKVPESFGVSIVFEADLFWETESGKLVSFYEEKPDAVLYEFPTAIATVVHSFDFVDSPAANRDGLFLHIDKKDRLTMQTLDKDLRLAEAEAKTDFLAKEIAVSTLKLSEIESQREQALKNVEQMAARIAELEKLGFAPVLAIVETVSAQIRPALILSEKISEYILQNPGSTRSTAVLSISKIHPELFNQ